MSKYRPLLESSSLNYFASEEDLRSLPEYSDSILKRFKFSWAWVGLLFLLLTRQFCLLVTIRLTSDYSMFLACVSLFILAAGSQILGFRTRSSPNSFCLLFIVSLFDTISYTLLLFASGLVSPLSLGVMIQLPIVFKLIMMLIVERQIYRACQNIGGFCLAVSATLMFILNWDSNMLCLLIGIVSMTVSFLVKSCYVRTHLADTWNMNKYCLTCSFFLSVMIWALTVYDQDSELYLQEAVRCVLGIDCGYSIFFFIGLVVSATLYQFGQWHYRNSFHLQLEISNGFVTMLAFALAGVYTGFLTFTVTDIVVGCCTVVGCFVYYIYPEPPPAISTSEDE